jgi:predicted Fe-Mo cluster-binding NifX family protein
MKVALPIIDLASNRNILASGLNVNGSICLYDVDSNSGSWIKTTDLAPNMGELLPALEALAISVIITHQIHPMALKILINKGFEVYKAVGNTLTENIDFYSNKKLDLYSHDAAMELATVCGGECTSCSTDVCDEEKKMM